MVEELGSAVSTLRRGDLVIAPFAFSDGRCPNCQNGITTACMNGGFFPMNGDGGQGEAVRVPLADTTLVVVPDTGHSEEMMRSLLTLSDVFATGHHAAVCAQVKPGDTVAVVGDGDGGVRVDGDVSVGVGVDVDVDARLECVGTGQSMQTAIDIARAGSMVGFVGVPHDVELPIGQMFRRTMAAWNPDELRRLAHGDELEKDDTRYASIVDLISDEEHRATTLRLLPVEQA